MFEPWYFVVVSLYVSGFFLAVAGTAVGLFRTVSAVSQAWLALLEIEVVRRRRIGNEIIDEYLDGDQRSDEPTDRRKARFLFRLNEIFGEAAIEERESARGIGRAILLANRPTGIGVFLGALLSTVASILALFPPV